MQRLALWWLRMRGWTIVGEKPAVSRFVCAAYPHTTNFDFIVFLAVTAHFGFRPSFIGKHTLFRPPFGWLMRRLGGISVRRDSRQGVSAQVAEAITEADEIAVVIAIEGTRSRAPGIRSGFHRIARAAGVPIQLAFVDYEKKRTGLGPLMTPSDDIQADVAVMRDYYAGVANGRHPENVSPLQLREE